MKILVLNNAGEVTLKSTYMGVSVHQINQTGQWSAVISTV